MKRNIFFLAILLGPLGSCTTSNAPTATSSILANGTYQGTLTRYTTSDTMSGTVAFTFSDTSYNYLAHIAYATSLLINNDSSRMDADFSFSRTNTTLTMMDRTDLLMVMWIHSFYLSGIHHYTFDGSALHIWQDTLGIAIDFKLKKQ